MDYLIHEEPYSCTSSPTIGPLCDESYLLENIQKICEMKSQVENYKIERDRMNQWFNELYNFTNNADEIDWKIKEELNLYI